jgi:hypothetical protein
MYLQSKSNVSVTALKRKFESVPFLPSSSASSRHEGIGVTHSHHVSKKDFKQVAVEKALPKSLSLKRTKDFPFDGSNWSTILSKKIYSHSSFIEE